MTPLEYYHEQAQRHLITEDAQQLLVVQRLQHLYDLLIRRQAFAAKMLHLVRKSKPITGLYLWGSVGIGKTFLMDCFYNCLPFKKKKRMHFHQFMQWLQHQLKLKQGAPDPLQVIAKEFSKHVAILCLDEFIVTDIVDAMILERLLRVLFKEGVCLVCTSNTKPDDLYKNGLQRDSFIPAIKLLQQHVATVHIPTTIDYRLRHLQHAGVYYTPNDAIAHDNMSKVFELLADHQPTTNQAIELHGRMIPVVLRTEKIIWFDFSVICSPPRSKQDYLTIAENYRTVLISNIPIIKANNHDTITLFIRLVDVFYDARIRMAFSAATAPEKIYTSGKLLAEYRRTASRLHEMQSQDYFIATHSQ